MKPYRYQVFIKVGKVDQIRSAFYKLAANPKIMHPDMLKEIPNYFLADKNEAAALDVQPPLGRSCMDLGVGLFAQDPAPPSKAAATATTPEPVFSDTSPQRGVFPDKAAMGAGGAAPSVEREGLAADGMEAAESATSKTASNGSSSRAASNSSSSSSIDTRSGQAGSNGAAINGRGVQAQAYDSELESSIAGDFLIPDDWKKLEVLGLKHSVMGILVAALAVVALVGVVAVTKLAPKVAAAVGDSTAEAVDAALASARPSHKAAHGNKEVNGALGASSSTVTTGYCITPEDVGGMTGAIAADAVASKDKEQHSSRNTGPRSSAQM
jgi:hypothetical protein